MTQLFGLICNQPQRVAQALEPVRKLLVSPAPIARWGLGYVQSGEVLLSRTPKSSEVPVDFYGVLEQLPSDYVIGHACLADGLAGNANTQPFRFRRWMFAMDAASDRFLEATPYMLEHVPEFLRRNIKGKTAAEHVFHVFLSFLHDAGSLDNHNLDPADARRALRDAVALAADACTRAGIDAKLGNIVTSNSRSMLAARLDGAVWMRRLKVPVAKRETETFKGVLAVSHTDDPGEGFEEIPPRSILAIARDIRTDIASMDD